MQLENGVRDMICLFILLITNDTIGHGQWNFPGLVPQLPRGAFRRSKISKNSHKFTKNFAFCSGFVNK